jgi:hypothetical protein
LDAQEFLELVLPQEGWLVGMAMHDGKVVRHQAFETVETLIVHLMRWDKQGFTTYHGCASFRENRKEGLRKHNNVLAVVSLWFDLDTRESHPDAKYADRAEAWEAVQAFCRATRLPPPVLVSSGGGLHCYWPLRCELSLDEWKALANGLKLAAQRYSLAADPQRTADAASVLRTPGTHHWKTGRIVECGEPVGPYEIEQFEHLKEFGSESGTRTRTTASRSLSPLARAAGAVYGAEPSDLAAVQAQCAQLERFAVAPGSCGEPVWYAVCGLAVHAGAGGVAWLDAFPYRDQSQRDTIAWNERKRAQWQAQVEGPPTCKHFESVNPGDCEGCRHKGSITSPILLGRSYKAGSTSAQEDVCDAEPAEHKVAGHESELGAPQVCDGIELPELPKNWHWSDSHQLTYMMEKTDGEYGPTVVSEYPIWLAGIHRTETTRSVSYAFKQYLPQHGVLDISIDAATMFSGRGVGEIAKAGGMVREPQLFLRYLYDARDQFIKDGRMGDRYEQLGWKDADQSFLVGTRLYTADGVLDVTVNDELTTRAQYLRPVGDVRKWTSTANRLFGGSMPAQLCVLASFAAPLMRFHTRHEGGAILSLLNRRSGTGKTMALEGAISVWGDPKGLEMTTLDTQAAKGLTFAAAANLPVMFDELATVAAKGKPELLYDLVMLFSSGHDKRRALQHGEGLRHVQGGWQTILLTASNMSIVDQLENFNKGTDAPGFRVIEVKADFPQRFDYATGDRLKAELFENAGAAGHVFLQHLLRPENMDYARKALDQASDTIYKHAGFKSQHRFWVRMLSAVYVAGQLVRSLGLFSVDEADVVAWTLEQLGYRDAPVTDDEREAKEDGEAVEVFDAFIREHLRDTLVVQKTWKPGDAKGEPHTRPAGRLLVRHELSTGRLSIPAKAFRSYVIESGYIWADVVRVLRDGGVLLDQKKMTTLSAGVQGLAGAPIPCMVFDMFHHSMRELLPLVEDPQVIQKETSDVSTS